MNSLLFAPHVFRGYKTLEDFVFNKNKLYEETEYPYKKRLLGNHKDKFIYILSKAFFEGGKKNSNQWLQLEESPHFSDCLFIYEDHEETMNIDYRWLEVMRRRRKGVYIKDACPVYIQETKNPNPHNESVPCLIPGLYPIYDKWDGKPFSIYGFNDPNSKYRVFPEFSSRDIDVLFIGKTTARRDVYISNLKKVTKSLGLNSIVSDQMVSFDEHIKLMRRAKICYQFMAIGYRSSREWESLINGSLLISDDRTVDNINIPGMRVGIDFVRMDYKNIAGQLKYYLEHEDERYNISRSGFDTAWNIWDGCLDPYMPSRKVAAEKIKESGWN